MRDDVAGCESMVAQGYQIDAGMASTRLRHLRFIGYEADAITGDRQRDQPGGTLSSAAAGARS